MDYTLIITFFTLTFIEIILGIDNLIFIALVVQKLPKKYSKSARTIGLSLAFIIRVLMLMALSWVMTLTKPIFNTGEFAVSVKDLLLIVGGLFLIIKSGMEISHDLFLKETPAEQVKKGKACNSFFSAVMQITLVDFIFSFDSVITAIAITTNIPVIVAAVVIAMIVMFMAAGVIGEFLNQYPSLKIIALAFIFLVGLILLADGLHIHIPKGYLYFSLFFTLAVESLNIAIRKKSE